MMLRRIPSYVSSASATVCTVASTAQPRLYHTTLHYHAKVFPSPSISSRLGGVRSFSIDQKQTPTPTSDIAQAQPATTSAPPTEAAHGSNGVKPKGNTFQEMRKLFGLARPEAKALIGMHKHEAPHH